MFPAGQIMTVNGAASVIENADHVLAGHTDLAEVFQAARFAKFPDALPWRLHAGWLPHHTRRQEPPRDLYPSVTDWWPNVSSGATSAGKAALIGLRMGFARVVLCGAPLDGSGYVRGETRVPTPVDVQRIGCASVQNRRTIVRYREAMKALAAGEFKGRVFSLSGYSREVLGAP